MGVCGVRYAYLGYMGASLDVKHFRVELGERLS